MYKEFELSNENIYVLGLVIREEDINKIEKTLGEDVYIDLHEAMKRDVDPFTSDDFGRITLNTIEETMTRRVQEWIQKEMGLKPHSYLFELKDFLFYPEKNVEHFMIIFKFRKWSGDSSCIHARLRKDGIISIEKRKTEFLHSEK